MGRNNRARLQGQKTRDKKYRYRAGAAKKQQGPSLAVWREAWAEMEDGKKAAAEREKEAGGGK